ncbi:metal-dependent hydrolase [Capsulimonas corticalis]|nr:metal-dependent hydrolase [Capsulimonas corticalis]
MMGRSHALAGVGSLWLLAAVPNGLSGDGLLDNVAVLAAVAALGALLPDLDASRSKLSSWEVAGVRPLVPLAALVHSAWGHRGPLHSLYGLTLIACVGGMLAPALGWRPAAALTLGFASHLAADACTRTGIPFLPWRKRRYWLLPSRLRLSTGSSAEDALLPLLALAALSLLLVHARV